MREALLFLTDGFEEIEALTVLDILRRGGVNTASVSLTGRGEVTGSHDITVKADMLYEALGEDDLNETVVLILPGGPGTANLKKHEPLLDLLTEHHGRGGRIAAICAAPSVLSPLAILEGKKCVCYPTVETELQGARIGRKIVEQDGNLISSKGPATALPFALAILREIKGKKAAKKVRKQTLEPLLRRAYA